LKNPDSSLIVAARQWVIDSYPHNNYHLLKTLDWLDRIAPEAAEATRIAALTHDMERAFPGPDQPKQDISRGFDDHDYNAAHSARSARIVGAWLRRRNTDEALVREVERLITVHEEGGWPEANLVQAADSLSFLETNVELFLNMARSGKLTIRDVFDKLRYTYERIQSPQARDLALPLYDAAKARVAAFEREFGAERTKT
jgi:Domain of unknown function (DUF4202)